MVVGADESRGATGGTRRTVGVHRSCLQSYGQDFRFIVTDPSTTEMSPKGNDLFAEAMQFVHQHEWFVGDISQNDAPFAGQSMLGGKRQKQFFGEELLALQRAVDDGCSDDANIDFTFCAVPFSFGCQVFMNGDHGFGI